MLSAAAKDKRVAAVISQCRFTNGAKPVMVPLAANLGETALMNAQDAMSGYQALKPAGEDIPNYVAARFALDIVCYYLGSKAKQIDVPVLLCVCENTTVAPSGPTFKCAAKPPRVL